MDLEWEMFFSTISNEILIKNLLRDLYGEDISLRPLSGGTEKFKLCNE